MDFDCPLHCMSEETEIRAVCQNKNLIHTQPFRLACIMEKMTCLALHRVMSVTQIPSGKTVTDLRFYYKIHEFPKVTAISETDHICKTEDSLSGFLYHTERSQTAIFW